MSGHHHHDPGGHTHDPMDHPGHFHERDQPLDRDFKKWESTL